MMGAPRKKVLFITTVDLSIESGGTRYSKSVLNAFAAHGEVEVVVLAHSQKIRNRKLRWVFAIVKSILTGIPPNVLFHSGLLRSETLKLINEPFDIVVIDHMESGHAVNGMLKEPFVYVSHNRESELIVQKLPDAPKWLKKILIAWVDGYEKRLAMTSGGIVSISSVEAEWYRQLNKNVGVVYPVFEAPPKRTFRESKPQSLRLGFLGSATWRPNTEAMDILINDILPLTTRKIELVVAGGAWQKTGVVARIKQSENLSNVSVNVLGYVSDIQEFWSSIDAFVAPIVSGAGVNVKVCEALNNGRPVIALPHAIRGMNESILSCGGMYAVNTVSEFSCAIEEFKLSRNIFPAPKEFTPEFAGQTIAKIIEGTNTHHGESLAS